MNRMKQRKRVKGFTLMELIVVIAIIGILLGILAPSMMTYYRKSRIKTANAEAKMVYNAAQTATQSLIAMDRGRTTKSEAAGNLIVSYADGEVRYTKAYCLWSSMTTVKQAGDSGEADIDRDVRRIADTVNRTVSNATQNCWTVVISNYIVKAAVAADSMNTNNVGYYTVNRGQASDATNHTYAQWLVEAGTGGDPVDSLSKAVNKYDSVTFTEAGTEAATAGTT